MTTHINHYSATLASKYVADDIVLDPVDLTVYKANDAATKGSPVDYSVAPSAGNGRTTADWVKIPIIYDSPQDLIDSQEASRGVGKLWIADEFHYIEADAAATDHHITNAKGVKLYCHPLHGVIYVESIAPDTTGATEITQINLLAASCDELAFPEGTFYCLIDATTPLTISGVSQEQTIITSELLDVAVTLTVNANVTLRNLTLKCKMGVLTAETVSHLGENKFVANHCRFEGSNHSPAVGLLSLGEFSDCHFENGNAPESLGARFHSPIANCNQCTFGGGRTLEVKDSKFYDCVITAKNIGSGLATAVHIPDGAIGNDGLANGYSGISEWHRCIIKSDSSGMTCGNAGHPKLRYVYLESSIVTPVSTALYMRSASTCDVDHSHIKANQNANAVSFSDLQGPGNIPRSGESVIKNSRLEAGNVALAIPNESGVYPASQGNVILYDCNIIGGDNKISPKTSTYYLLKTEKFLDYTESLFYLNDNETLKFRFKVDGMKVTVAGSDGPKTGCHLSHLDAITGEKHPDGMKIQLRYGGVASRFVTFATGVTDDGGAMRFAGNASTFTVTQHNTFLFILDNTVWRQVDV